jgi:hypothetical protein
VGAPLAGRGDLEGAQALLAPPFGKGIREFKQSVSGDEHPPLPAPIPPAETTDQS